MNKVVCQKITSWRQKARNSVAMQSVFVVCVKFSTSAERLHQNFGWRNQSSGGLCFSLTEKRGVCVAPAGNGRSSKHNCSPGLGSCGRAISPKTTWKMAFSWNIFALQESRLCVLRRPDFCGDIYLQHRMTWSYVLRTHRSVHALLGE